jgi:folate-binding Fe-S cluster repair protein YgfZ
MTVPKTDFCCHLTNRTIIEIQGSDREAFLQGIITQDIKLLDRQSIIYSLMLSPQGKFQFDFFKWVHSDKSFIFVEAEAVMSQKLKLVSCLQDPGHTKIKNISSLS